MAAFELPSNSLPAGSSAPATTGPGEAEKVAGFEPSGPAGEMAGFGSGGDARKYRATVPRSIPNSRARNATLGPTCRMQLFYRLRNRHLENIRHRRSPATRKMLLNTYGEFCSIQNGCFSFRPSGWFYPTRNDARYPQFVTIHYPLHPFYGRGSLAVSQRCGVGGVAQLFVVSETTIQAVPLWMTDEELCARMTIGCDPYCSLKALLELHSLLRSTGV